MAPTLAERAMLVNRCSSGRQGTKRVAAHYSSSITVLLEGKMSLQRSRSDISAAWKPAPSSMDPSLRLQTYGRIRPLESDRTWLDRLLRR